MSPPASLVAGRELRVALTCPWHARSARDLGIPELAVEARPAFYPDERVLWLAEHSALVFGDSFSGGPIPDDWLRKDKRAPITARGSRRSSRPSGSSCPLTETLEGVTCSSEPLPDKPRQPLLTAITLI
jgi:hypothetical protein